METISPIETRKIKANRSTMIRRLGVGLASIDLLLTLTGCGGKKPGSIDCYVLNAEYKVPMSEKSPTYNFPKRWRKCVDKGTPAPACEAETWDVLNGSSKLVSGSCKVEKEEE